MIKLKIGFMASHNGSNMQAIIDSIESGKLHATANALVSNNSKAGAIERAIKHNIPFYHISNKTHPDPNSHDQAIIDAFTLNGVDTIVLAGYMKILSPMVIDHFKRRVLNIHPALLPKFGGEGMYGSYVHEAVIAAGEKKSGATIHLVDSQYDRGRILAYKEVDVFESDTAEILAERVIKVEHFLYSDTLQKIALGEIII